MQFKMRPDMVAKKPRPRSKQVYFRLAYIRKETTISDLSTQPIGTVAKSVFKIVVASLVDAGTDAGTDFGLRFALSIS